MSLVPHPLSSNSWTPGDEVLLANLTPAADNKGGRGGARYDCSVKFNDIRCVRIKRRCARILLWCGRGAHALQVGHVPCHDDMR